jgi:hypothetical protein
MVPEKATSEKSRVTERENHSRVEADGCCATRAGCPETGSASPLSPQDDVLVLVAGQPRGTHEMLRLLHEAVVGDSGRETQRRAGAGTGAGVGRIRLLLRQHPRATAEERLAAAQFK